MSRQDGKMLYGSSTDWRMLSSYVGGGWGEKKGEVRLNFSVVLILFSTTIEISVVYVFSSLFAVSSPVKTFFLRWCRMSEWFHVLCNNNNLNQKKFKRSLKIAESNCKTYIVSLLRKDIWQNSWHFILPNCNYQLYLMHVWPDEELKSVNVQIGRATLCSTNSIKTF